MHNPSRPAKCTVDLMTKLPYCTDDVRSALKSQIIELFWGRVLEVSYGRTSINRRALTLRCTSKVKPHCGTRGGVEGIHPSLSFWYVTVLRNDFALSEKPLIFSTRWGIFYGWWCCWRSVTSSNMVAILAAILYFIKN